MATAFLIDIDSLKKLGYVQNNVEVSIVRTTLRRVQDTMLLPILGTAFYKRLLEGVNNSDLTADEETLLTDYITPVLVAGVDYKIVLSLNNEIRSKAVGRNSDEHIQANSEGQDALYRNELRKDYEVYRTRLIGYLCDNDTLFPTYKDYTTKKEDVKPDKGGTFSPIRFV